MFESLTKYGARPWFPLLVAFLHWLDTFILVVPNDVFLVAAVAAKPKIWAYMATLQTIGCLLGCLTFYAIALYDPNAVKHRYPSVFESETWQNTEDMFRMFGVGAAGLLSVFLPIHPFLFVGALSNVNITLLVSSIVGGRFVRNLVVCYLATKAPGFSLKQLLTGQKQE